MFQYVCFFIALGIIALFAALTYRNRRNMSEAISCILGGILLSSFFMVLPTEWVKEGKEVVSQPLYSILSSLLYSLKVLGGRQDLAQLETMALPGILKNVYMVINYIGFALAPILTSSLILSFVGDTGEKMRFLFRFSPKCYVFSEINENSLSLAAGLNQKKGKKTIVFCNSKNVEKGLLVKAKKLGAITLYKPCTALKISKRFGAYEFFLIHEQEDQNILLTETIIAKYAPVQKPKIILNAFVESGTNVNFLENALKAKGEDISMELRCIDETALLCNHLVYAHPLYHNKGNVISVAIIGCSETGMRMLKTVYWAGQIDGYTLKIRVYDKDADAIKADFYRQCPGLTGNSHIRFIKTDVGSHDFKEQLLADENSGDATYIVVTMGSDQLNLSVSDELYRTYRRHVQFNDALMPEIFTRVRAQAKSAPYFENGDFLAKRHIHLFGTASSVFSEEILFDTELENLALAVHLAYWDSLDIDRNSPQYGKILRDFKTSEYSRRSSMATALHLGAKLWMCAGTDKTGSKMLTEANVSAFAKCLQEDATLLPRLSRNEHDRWNAFMLSEGYQAATEEEMHLYAAAVNNHKDELSMLHPCIAPWEKLDDLQNAYNDTYKKNKKFKYYDEAIVKNLPKIWALAQEMKK